MKRKRYRRKSNVHRANRAGRKTVPVILALCFAVLAGYMTATQLLGPALGLEVQPVFESVSEKYLKKDKKDNSDEKKQNEVIEDQIDVVSESGFALQYGSFSSEEGARKCAEELKSEGVQADIVEKDGSFKVIGEVFDTKEEARSSKSEYSGFGEVFVTEIP